MQKTQNMTTRETTLFRPTASIENLARRAKLYRAIRRYFDDRDFIETTTPTLSRDVVVDRFVEAIPVRLERCWQERDEFVRSRFSERDLADKNATTFYLQTSPEFAMKRLVAAGMDAIYQLAPAYRKGDRGTLHNVEFTMLEWYRVGDDYRTGRDLLSDMISKVADDFYASVALQPRAWAQKPTAQLPFAAPFLERTGIDPLNCQIEDLKRFADDNKVAYPESFLDPNANATKDDWIDLVFSEKVQPTLGFDAPVLLFDYPASQAQLAKTGIAENEPQDSKRTATKRFELFIEGAELANGYDELLDPSVLRKRNITTAEERKRDGSEELPSESRLLAAMDRGLPQCSGCALGVDRFLLVLLGAKKLEEVLAFPTELA